MQTENASALHVPVMADTVLKYIEPKPKQTFVDMTFGAGGHATRILDSVPDSKVFALDRDPVAHELAHKLAAKYPGRVIPLLGRFSELPNLFRELKVRQGTIDGILFDFGCSSMQFDVANRGFSVSKDGPLDMRMDGLRCPEQPTVADVLARADEEDLARIIKVYGEEKQAKKIARAIIEVRYSFKKLETTRELAQLVDSALGSVPRQDMLGRYTSNATKTFQAFRIFVNNELNEINYGMFVAERYLKPGGRLLTIAFHSLEDTIVKRHISGNISGDVANTLPLKYVSYGMCHEKYEVESLMQSPWEMLHKHVITPTIDEVESNPRSRSAKFRAAICMK
ncbi:probable methyltransferase-like protein 15 homolog [Neodiprion pinetum]|uniref:probable methyltransferase-like protein 15 homolog n=1 Tax=Neodiprion pinetum TaxID=441929 RepID=UPI001EDD3265|nr:probable methyltransferase-like protein 15 homolog [Neodiprion pinetum]